MKIKAAIANVSFELFCIGGHVGEQDGRNATMSGHVRARIFDALTQ